MCGIAGYFGSQSRGLIFLSEAVVCLKHRGPDGHGTLDFGWAGLSHTRLALIAPGPAGAQPLESTSLSCIFNGEIFNWRELALELEKSNVNFPFASDAQLLLAALDTWGIESTLKKLRGIFSFAVLDKRSKHLTLARDAAGTKPLYYKRHEGTIYFSSEIKAFKKFNLEIDQSQLQEYLTFQNSLTSKTLFKDVFLVPQGSIVEFHHSQSQPITRIWDPSNFSSDAEMDITEATKVLGDFFGQAMDRNLVADFPVGLFLSGGLDSSTIAMYAAKRNPSSLSFTIGFENPHDYDFVTSKDERVIAGKIAQLLSIENRTYEVTHQDFEDEFDSICWAIEEPRVGQSYPNYFAAKLAQKYSKSVMSGAGGDELFAGYPWRYRKTLFSENLGKDAQIDSYFKFWHRLGTVEDIASLLGISQETHLVSGKSAMRDILELNSTSKDKYVLEDLLFFEYKTFLQGLLLVDDKLSMAHGLEIRVPFLDQDLAKFAMTLPNKFRLRNFETLYEDQSKINFVPATGGDEVQGKFLLRELARIEMNPTQTLPKMGFSGPDASWFRHESRNFVADRILDKNSLVWDHLDFKIGKDLINRHMEGQSNQRLLIWSLLSLESVFRQFL